MEDIFNTSEVTVILRELKRFIELEDDEECLDGLQEDLEKWELIKDEIDNLILSDRDVISDDLFRRFVRVFTFNHFSDERKSLKGKVHVFNCIDFGALSAILKEDFEEITIEGTLYQVPVYDNYGYTKAIETLKFYLGLTR